LGARYGQAAPTQKTRNLSKRSRRLKSVAQLLSLAEGRGSLYRNYYREGIGEEESQGRITAIIDVKIK